MNRRYIYILLVILSFVLTGCGSVKYTTESKKLTRAGYVEYDSRYITVGVVQTGSESGRGTSNTDDFIYEFSDSNGYNLICVDSNSDIDRQIKAVYDLIAQQVDYIIIEPITKNGWEDVLKEAHANRIPVIIVGNEIDADESLYECLIGSGYYEEGVSAAKWLESYIKERGWEDEEINIALIEGTENDSITAGRTAGIMSVIDNHSKWKVVDSEYGNFKQNEGYNAMSRILDKNNEIHVLIVEGSTMTIGAMNSMRNHDVSYGVDGDIITISFDVTQAILKKLTKGSLVACVEHNPFVAKVCSNIIQELKEDKKIDKVQYIDENIITYRNASDYVKSHMY